MPKLQGALPLGKDTPMNVAVQRPTVNVKEAENVGEQAAAITDRYKASEGLRFSKHGVLGPSKPTGLHDDN